MRTIQSRRYVPFNRPGDLRARLKELIGEGWFLTAIARPSGYWHGRWACLFLERRGNRPPDVPTPAWEPLPWSTEALRSADEAERREMKQHDAWLREATP